MAVNRSIYYKERSWNDIHIYSSKVLTGGVKIIQPSVYHEMKWRNFHTISFRILR